MRSNLLVRPGGWSLSKRSLALDAGKVFSVLVEVNGVEVKGPVTELALAPGAELSWLFVPIKPGKYQLLCPVSGHVEAGMVGALRIIASSK